MTLYDQFIQTIKAIQDKNIIVNNIIKGQDYAIFKIKYDINNPDLLDIKLLGTTQKFPDFELDELYLPSLLKSNMLNYVQNYKELSLCMIKNIKKNYITIDIQQTLINFKENTINFNSHELPFFETETEQKSTFINNYYLICNYLKETLPIPKQKKYAFVINFDVNFYKFPSYSLKIVNPEDFQDFEFLFFLENKKNIKEKSNLIFYLKGKSTTIDIKKSITKIDTFNAIKNF